MTNAIPGSAAMKLCHHGCTERKSLMSDHSRATGKINVRIEDIATARRVPSFSAHHALGFSGSAIEPYRKSPTSAFLQIVVAANGSRAKQDEGGTWSPLHLRDRDE